MQQTRVNQGMDYYLKFVSHYPEITDLAQASEQEVLADWQGLGYYSRARNLHHAAREIASLHQGVFPQTFEDIKKLKGIGDYTASAIASFAFDLSYAVVDGNVFRVLSRVFDIDTPIDTGEGKKIFDELARTLLGDNPPAIHNQAIMEFGALQCVPVNPDCAVCPLAEMCLARRNGTISERPQKRGKIVPKNRYFHYLQFASNGNILIEKRVNKDIWQHLFQFPLIETGEEISLQEARTLIVDRYGLEPLSVSPQIRHILTHQRIHAHVWKFDAFPSDLSEKHWIEIAAKDLSSYPIPRILDRYLEND